jgi:hypothetical protein
MSVPEPFPGGIVAPQDWLNAILPRAPNLAPDFVKNEILSVVRDFCDRGGVWRDWVGPITLHPNQVHYSVELADYKAELVDILDGYRVKDEIRMMPVPSDNVGADPNVYLNQEPYIGGPPRFYYKDPEGLAVIIPPPADDTEQVRLFVTMKPVDLCFPDWIKSRFYEPILNGVMARVHMMKGPCYDPNLGARLERRYRAERDLATQRAIASGTGLPEIARPMTIIGGSQRHSGRMAADRAVSGTRW